MWTRCCCKLFNQNKINSIGVDISLTDLNVAKKRFNKYKKIHSYRKFRKHGKNI